MLCYFSIRRFCPDGPQCEHEQHRTAYNRQRTIRCSLVNSKNGAIETIYSIDVVPLPDGSEIEF